MSDQSPKDKPKASARRLAALMLETLDEQGRLRRLRALGGSGGVFSDKGRRLLNFASNDYLDMARHPNTLAGAMNALERWGAGATASRLMSGHLELHAEAEATLCDWLDYPAALIAGSGFLTNLGVVGALADTGAVVFEDRLNHASLIDGARLSGARLVRYRHGDAGHLRDLLRRHAHVERRFVVTDTVFSMDGDIAPLEAIAGVCVEAGVPWVADEAHAIGILGPEGRGACASLGLRPDLLVGTFSKALGSYGGFVATQPEIRELLINRARGFIYSTALPPPCIGAAMGALATLRSDTGMGARLLARSERFRDRLLKLGLDTGSGCTPIVPVMLGESRRAMAVAEALDSEGLLTVAVRPPTVPSGTSRLRLSVTLAHSSEELDRAAELIARAVCSVSEEVISGRNAACHASG